MTEYEFWDLFISGLAAVATLLAVIVALFGERISKWINRPIIGVHYWYESERCNRSVVPLNDKVQDFPQIIPAERQCFRLKVYNGGKETARRVKVVLDLFYYENKQVAERFEPSSLRWVSCSQETIDLASKEATYINLLSQITKIKETNEKIPPNYFVLRWELFNMMPRGIAWDRESRKFLIKLIIHGDNFEPQTQWLKFVPDEKDIFVKGKLLYFNEKIDFDDNSGPWPDNMIDGFIAKAMEGIRKR